MARRPDNGNLCVMDRRTVTITLHVEVDGDDVRGSASDGGDDPRSFAGWLGLIGSIDALLGFPPDRGAAIRLAPEEAEIR